LPNALQKNIADPHTRLLARRVVALARKVGVDVVAERVETRGQLEYLRSIGCDRAQGFVYTRPVPGALVSKFLRFS
jgi:EAL domain-containing protein (putative c-di-GMP-specific phosphodiesterase class I)